MWTLRNSGTLLNDDPVAQGVGHPFGTTLGVAALAAGVVSGVQLNNAVTLALRKISRTKKLGDRGAPRVYPMFHHGPQA